MVGDDRYQDRGGTQINAHACVIREVPSFNCTGDTGFTANEDRAHASLVLGQKSEQLVSSNKAKQLGTASKASSPTPTLPRMPPPPPMRGFGQSTGSRTDDSAVAFPKVKPYAGPYAGQTLQNKKRSAETAAVKEVKKEPVTKSQRTDAPATPPADVEWLCKFMETYLLWLDGLS